MKRFFSYFTKFEIILWCVSVATIAISAVVFQTFDWLTMIASVMGATFLILTAKGNVWGQVLTVIFSILYGIISYRTAYYGEMITYLGMSAPIAIASVVSWFRNPVQKGKLEVKVNNLKAREYVFLFVLTCIVTVIFYFILKACNTALLIWSTVSVFTSFFAAYLTMRRCEYYALAYTANDIVLIIMWSVAAVQNKSYVSVIICFLVFLVNDLYGFFNWSKMKKAQAKL